MNQTPKNSVILVQTSTVGTNSQGLLARIAREHQDLFKEQHEFCAWYSSWDKQNEVLGSFLPLKFKDFKGNFTGKMLAICFTLHWDTQTTFDMQLEAWKLIAPKIAKQVRDNRDKTGVKYTVHIPTKIGIGMKPGEQEQVKEVLDKTFSVDYPDVDLYYHE